MSLYAQLQTARSEEDVKDAYIKALGLKGYTKGLIDIQTREIWFEAKDTGKYSSYAMVQDALNKGEAMPPFLAVIDTEKAALMKSADVLPFLAKKTVKWGKSASQYTPEALAEISAYIGTHFVSFKIATHEDEFINTVKTTIKSGDIIRTQITPDNLKQVFDKWVEMIGREINGVAEEHYALLFFADIMHDGTVSTHANLSAELLHKNGAPVFSLGAQASRLHADGTSALQHTHATIYELGNLEVKHSNPRNIYMSTLDQADINLPNSHMLTHWIARQKSNETEVLPLINAITPTTKTKGVRRTQWSLVNHFIPYTESEVGASDRFESDFMVQYLAGLPTLPKSPQPPFYKVGSQPNSPLAKGGGAKRHRLSRRFKILGGVVCVVSRQISCMSPSSVGMVSHLAA